MAGWPQASSSLPGFSYSPRQAVVSAPSKTTNQLRVFTKAQTNRMDIGANNEQLASGQLLVAGLLILSEAGGGLRTEQHHQPT